MDIVIAIMKALFKDEKRIAVFIPKEPHLIEKIKKVPNSRWSYTLMCWHFPHNKENWGIFKHHFQDITLNIQGNLEPLIIPLADMEIVPKVEKKVAPLPFSTPFEKLGNIESTKSHGNVPVSSNSMSIQSYPIPHYQNLSTQLAPPQYTQTKQPVPEMVHVSLADFWKGYLRIDLPYRRDWLTKIRQIEGRKWHPVRKCWTLPHSPLVLDLLKKYFHTHLVLDLPLLSPSHETVKLQNENQNQKTKNETPPQYQDEVERLVEKMTLKRMSETTIKTYKNGFTQFLHYYNEIHPKNITKEQISAYLLHRIRVHKISESLQNNFINAIKCYYEFVLGRDRTYYDLQRPKKPFTLPNILSPEEVVVLIKAVENIKHKCILLAIYSAGLRLSEVINLRMSDIRRDDNSIFIKGGKGKKDRYTLLSQTLIEEIAKYQKLYKTNYWLFEGETGGQYSPRSVQYILRDAVNKSGVNPFATVHTLRHSFATHLVLAGHDILSVQKLMGHESPVTTEIYVHLTGEQIRRIQSPLDMLKL